MNSTAVSCSNLVRNKQKQPNESAAPPPSPPMRHKQLLKTVNKKNPRSSGSTSAVSVADSKRPSEVPKPVRRKRKVHQYYQMYLEMAYHDLRNIRGLPSVSVSDLRSRKVLLPSVPSSRKTVIFDLDETLVHCCDFGQPADVQLPFMYGSIGINIRPYVLEMLSEVKQMYEVGVFTASQQSYADVVLNYLDPANEIFEFRLYRESCIQAGNLFVKDLRILENRKLNSIVLVDNLPHSFAFQINNGIPVVSWYDSKDDTELLGLLDYLKCIAFVNDVRVPNKDTFRFNTAFDNNS